MRTRCAVNKPFMNPNTIALFADGQFSVIFLGPLALSVVATLFYLNSEESLVSKCIALALVGTSVFLQFGPWFDVHFLIPLALQLVVCIWMAIYWQMQ